MTQFSKMVWRAGLEPAQARYLPVLHRAYCTPSLTERNGTIRGPATGRRARFDRGRGEMRLIPRQSPRSRNAGSPADPYVSRPDQIEIPLSLSFFRVSSRVRHAFADRLLNPGPVSSVFHQRQMKFKFSLGLSLRAGRMARRGSSPRTRLTALRVLHACRQVAASAVTHFWRSL